MEMITFWAKQYPGRGPPKHQNFRRTIKQ